MPYGWIRFLHIVSAVAFVALHGTSIAVLHAIRNERARPRIQAVLDFSGRTSKAMYVSLVAVVGTGFWMGFERNALFRQYWYWWSLGLVVATSALMWFVAKPFTARLRAACEIRPSGVPRVSDGELAETLHSSQPNLIAGIGVGGLVAILYLMVFQPALIGDGSFGGPPTSASEQLLARGEELFQRTAGGVGCASCHGTDGRGTGVAPPIVDATEAQITRALDGGVPEMAGIELDPVEIEAVHLYLQSLR